jgi:hypothetical protein
MWSGTFKVLIDTIEFTYLYNNQNLKTKLELIFSQLQLSPHTKQNFLARGLFGKLLASIFYFLGIILK